MTDRAEIERLLNQTGRTLEGLPDIYPDEQRQAMWEEIANADEEPENRVLHQSDVIELLVGALRDALDKPLQKPLTLEEINKFDDPVWIEFKVFTSANGWRDGISDALYWAQRVYLGMFNPELGKAYRMWRHRPTDEERSAAAWES